MFILSILKHLKMIKNLFFIIFIFHLFISNVHSHFSSVKDFESTLTKCCSIGGRKAVSIDENESKLDVCLVSSNDVAEIASELQPQCRSIIKLCCNQELNKQTCKFSKSIVIQRLDQTEYSLNKNKSNSTLNYSNNKFDEALYRQCLPNPNLAKLYPMKKLFAEIVLKIESQIYYSECCVACKLGLFSALNDYKCIIQKNIRSSKLFEETFYDCCFNFKKELDLASGRSVDLASLELIIYPELKPIIPSFKMNFYDEPKIDSQYKELVTSSSFKNHEKSYLEKHLKQETKLLDHVRTQIINPDTIIRKELKDVEKLSNQSNVSSCPEGMRLDSYENQCVLIDMCKENLHSCGEDESCSKTNSGFKCIKKIVEKLNDEKVKDVHLSQNQTSNSVNNEPKLNKDPIILNKPHFPNPFVNPPNHYIRVPIRPQPPIYNTFYHPTQMPPNRMIPDQFAQSNPFYQYRNQYQSRPQNQLVNNPLVSNQRFSKRKIDKCKIGNHNCKQTQTCRTTKNDYICIDNQDLDEYDRSNSYFDDYLIMTTTSPQSIYSNDNKMRRMNDYQNNKICDNGFELNLKTNSCDDVDECELATHNCPADQKCVNKFGSFICVREPSCRIGYIYSSETSKCEDINECNLGMHNCKNPFRCVNYDGSFRCELGRCKEGEQWLNNKCAQVICEPGYAYDTTIEKCMDIDECSIGVAAGDLQLIVSNKNEQNEQFNANKLEKTPSIRLTNGRYAACNKDEKCLNHPGGFVCQNDLDEKSIDETNKEKPVVVENTIGRYLDHFENNSNLLFRPECLSDERYDLEKKKCIFEGACKVIQDSAYLKLLDLKNSRTKYCAYKCVKTNVGWNCVCPKGFILKRNGLKCLDVDECSNSRICEGSSSGQLGGQSHCVNTRGSYKCVDISCPNGYLKNIKNKLQCVIIDKSSIFLQKKPKYISYSFIPIQSNISLIDDDFSKNMIKIASIRGVTSFNVDYKLISVVSSNLNPGQFAKKQDFYLKREDSDHIFLKRSLIGPQEIKLEFIYTTNQDNRRIIMNKLMLFIYVSEHSF